MGIIATEKENLRTELAVAVNRVREQELSFYSKSLEVIGTEATLLVSLAFSLIAGWDPILPYEGYLPGNLTQYFEINHLSRSYEGDRGIAGWDWEDWYIQIMQIAFLMTSMYSTIKLLSIVQMCVFAEFRGVGLALRGPDGSLQSAVHKMQRQQEYQALAIRRALKSLGLSLILLCLVRFPFVIGVAVVLSSIPWVYRAWLRDKYTEESFRFAEATETRVTWFQERRNQAQRIFSPSLASEQRWKRQRRAFLLWVCCGKEKRLPKRWLPSVAPGLPSTPEQINKDTVVVQTNLEVDALINKQQKKLMNTDEAAIRIQAIQRGKTIRSVFTAASEAATQARPGERPRDSEATMYSGHSMDIEWPASSHHNAVVAGEPGLIGQINQMLFPGGRQTASWPGEGGAGGGEPGGGGTPAGGTAGGKQPWWSSGAGTGAAHAERSSVTWMQSGTYAPASDTAYNLNKPTRFQALSLDTAQRSCAESSSSAVVVPNKTLMTPAAPQQPRGTIFPTPQEDGPVEKCLMGIFPREL